MRNQHFEVPFIAFYRKEYVLPELNVNDLWKVYKYDGKVNYRSVDQRKVPSDGYSWFTFLRPSLQQWCQLKARKSALLELFESMRDYQLQEYTVDVHSALPDDIRLLGDDDILQ